MKSNRDFPPHHTKDSVALYRVAFTCRELQPTSATSFLIHALVPRTFSLTCGIRSPTSKAQVSKLHLAVMLPR